VNVAQVKTDLPPAVAGAKPATVERIKIRGASLDGNLEGNAVDRDALVVLPPTYSTEKRRRYPVVYALHGYSIGAEQWSKEIHVPQTIEGAFAQGAREMIVVLPDSKTVHNGSMYSSSITISDDGWAWRRAGTLMQALPGGRPGPEVIARGGNNTWAPDVIRSGDKYFVYYSAPGTQPKAAIGLLVGRTLDPVIGIYNDRQTVIDDGVSRRLTLKKGPNVIRGAIVNAGGATDFCARFLDGEGRPVKALSISLADR